MSAWTYASDIFSTAGTASVTVSGLAAGTYKLQRRVILNNGVCAGGTYTQLFETVDEVVS